MTSRVWSLLALVCLTGCSRQAGQPPPQGMPPAPVKLETVGATDIQETTEYVAAVKSMQSTPVQPQVDGVVTQIDVRSGQRVAAGQRIVQIDARRQQAAVTSTEAAHAAKQAAVNFARSQLQRAKDLLSAGAISRQEYEQAETALRTAEADLKSHEAQVQQGQVQLRYYTVVAPTAGIIGDVPVRVGNLVTPQTVLTTIDQNTRLEIHVQVPLERAPDLKLGLPIQLLDSSGAVAAPTTITFISPRVDGETQEVLVKGLLPNPGTLRAQQFVRARIVWKSGKGIAIPVLAVTRVGGQYFVFAAEQKDGGLAARQRPVKVGRMIGDTYEILDGLKPGDRVVVSGVQKLADGVPIAPDK